MSSWGAVLSHAAQDPALPVMHQSGDQTGSKRARNIARPALQTATHNLQRFC